MKPLTFFPVLLLAASLPAFAEDKPLNSTLTFSDQTHITGHALAINGEKKLLHFTSPSLQGKIPLKTEGLLEMTLDGTPKDLEADHYALATIKPHFGGVGGDPHQDTLRGRLVQLDDESITLDTWYAGQLTLKRSLVQALDLFQQSPTLYNGPNGPDGWVTPVGSAEDNWTFENRAMISKNRAGIARKVEIPERAKITATARWKGSTSFRILFLSEDPSDHPDTGYALNIYNTTIRLDRMKPGENSQRILNQRIDSLQEVEEIDVTIYLDQTKNGTSAIYLDDKRIGTWTDIDDTALTGEWLHFIPGFTAKPLHLSKISVGQWDGSLPATTEDSPPAGDDDEKNQPKGQEIRLANGDIVVGTIQTIDKDLVHLDTNFGKVRIPLRRMKSIALAPIEDQDRMEINDVRAWFHEGGYVTIKLKSFDGKTIKGYSQVYGEAEFDINAFARIQFNIWTRNQDLARLRRTNW